METGQNVLASESNLMGLTDFSKLKSSQFYNKKMSGTMTKHKSGSTSFVLGLLLAYGNDDNTASDVIEG